ncbi:hypothetical protein PAE9249_04868 [Paenibacillus sp. CECT 9249]|uniref:extracellular solute-binding protein n=1 Tax=Paenibacillus sp. CECT 9249 TaxID=2845385 RepID=UPI001E4E195C|nr:extracellular solute-binding protein [Paenibacillus sp. CECT 9249]CAH0122319.1 hypothetical protein PAE9249_04868 [Paenibacillus sp. CECT 9249]
MRKKMLLKTSFLSLLAAMLLVAGCSGNGATNTTKTESQGEQGQAEARGSISLSVYDRSMVPAEEGTIESNRWTRWLNDNGPADLKFTAIPRWEFKEKFNVLFASGSAPDLIFEYATGYRNELINQKQLMPLGDLIEQHSTEYKALLEKYPLLQKVAARDDGNIYEFGRINGLATNQVLYVRKDWLDKLNLPVPKTVEEFYNVAEAFVKQDPDGNGQKDTFAIGVTGVGAQVIDSMFQDVGYKVQDGTMVRTWDNSIAKSNFIKKLYDNGLIDKDFLTDKNGEKAKQDFINGKMGFYGANGGAMSEGYLIFSALKKNVPDAKVMAIPLPASEFGQFSPSIQNPVQATAAINSNAKDPVAVMKYVDFLVRESTMKTMMFGVEGEHYAVDDSGCPKPIDQEKNKKELDWNIDFRMLASPAFFGECGKYQNQLDPSNPIDQEFLEIIQQAEEAYLTPERPIADYTHGEYKPSLPKDLELIVTNTGEQMVSYYQQALVGGGKYTVEQAAQDARAFWEKAGGKKVDDWMAEWYKTHADTAILTDDLYDITIE